MYQSKLSEAIYADQIAKNGRIMFLIIVVMLNKKYQDLFLSLRVSEKGNHTPSFACVVKGLYQDATLFNKRRFSK
jgi:hypothetical protein